MKIGISAFAWTTTVRQSHLDLLPMLRDRGFDGFEIPITDPRSMDVVAHRQAFESSDLDCTVCVLLPQDINPISPERALRERALAHLRECVEVSAQIGAHLVGGPVFAPNGYLPGRSHREREMEWAVECFRSLGETLDKYGVTLSIEPVNRSETCFLNTAAEAKLLCEAVDHPRIGVTVDTFHANIEEIDTAQAVRLLGKNCKHMHMSEDHRGLLGTGSVNFAGILAALQGIGYEGYLTIEGFGYSPNEPDSFGAMAPEPKASPEELAFNGAEYLRSLISGR